MHTSDVDSKMIQVTGFLRPNHLSSPELDNHSPPVRIKYFPPLHAWALGGEHQKTLDFMHAKCPASSETLQ